MRLKSALLQPTRKMEKGKAKFEKKKKKKNNCRFRDFGRVKAEKLSINILLRLTFTFKILNEY